MNLFFGYGWFGVVTLFLGAATIDVNKLLPYRTAMGKQDRVLRGLCENLGEWKHN